MDNLKMALDVAKMLDNKKASDIKLIDISSKSSFADYMILATGGSMRQLSALVDDVEDVFAKLDIMPKNVEGKQNSEWVLVDYRDILINIFTKDARDKYNIEKVWGDCPEIEFETEI